LFCFEINTFFALFQVLITVVLVRTANLVIDKISHKDKMRIQTFRKIVFGYWTIVASFCE